MVTATIATPGLWAGFITLIALLLALDLGVFHRRPHEVSVREGAIWSAVWFTIALLFAAGVSAMFGVEKGLEFATGYFIEKALAVDNIFVFVVIFSTFKIPRRLQHRVLFWGVCGALVMRAGFIFAGGALIERFHWALYVFGVVLALLGLKLLVQRERTSNLEENLLIRTFRKIVPVTETLDGDRFIVFRNGTRKVTPLLLALLAVEVTDLVFAVDSIPAIFAVTTDPFIVFTSNIFAILGLRSLYFLLSGIVDRFVYLKTGLALVLLFVGLKMLSAAVIEVSIGVSLGIIASIITASVVASLVATRKAPRASSSGAS